MKVIPDAFSGLAEYNQWVLWAIETRDGKDIKVPYNPRTMERASSVDASTWVDANSVLVAAAANPTYGVGFVFTEHDPFFFYDIDKAYNDGTWDQIATDSVNTFNGCAVEVSQSGTGLHIIGKADHINHRNKHKDSKTEFYTRDRFVALTGMSASGDSNFKPERQVIEKLVADYFPPREAIDVQWGADRDPAWHGTADDNQLIQKMLVSQSVQAAFGNKASIAQLWAGEPSALAEFYPSPSGDDFDWSSADAALCAHLAFWTGKDSARIDRLMRLSGLMRDKWANRSDYVQNTVVAAIGGCQKVYNDGKSDGVDGVRRSSKFRLIGVSEIMKKLAPTQWLIPGYIEKQTLNLVFGASASGKTYLVLHWSICVALGAKWFGREVKKGGVVYLAGEGHRGISKRLAALDLSYGLKVSDALFVMSERGASLVEGNGTDEVITAIDENLEITGKIELIVIDTMHRNFGAGDENSAKDFGVFLKNIDILSKHYGAAVLIVHHSGYGQTDRSRGSSAIKGAMDGEFLVTKNKVGDVGLECTKNKDFELPKPMRFNFKTIELGGDGSSSVLELSSIPNEDGKALTVNQIGAVKAFGECLVKAKYECVDAGEWMDAYCTGFPDRSRDTNRKAFKRALNDFSGAGVIERLEMGWRVTTGRCGNWNNLTRLFSSHISENYEVGGQRTGPDKKDVVPQEHGRHGHTPIGVSISPEGVSI